MSLKAKSTVAPELARIRALLEQASGGRVPDVVAGVEQLLRQHGVLLGKYTRAKELLQLEWSASGKGAPQ